MSSRTEGYHWIVVYDMLMIKRPLPDDIKEMSDVGYLCLTFFENELGTHSYLVRLAYLHPQSELIIHSMSQRPQVYSRSGRSFIIVYLMS